MRSKCVCGLALSLSVSFLALAVFAQGIENSLPHRTTCESESCISKVMHLPSFSTPNETQDVINAFRVIIEINNVTQNPSEHTVSLEGSAEQIAMAEELVSILENFKSSGSIRSIVLVHDPQGSRQESAASERPPEQPIVIAHTTHCELTTCYIKALYLPDLSVRQLQETLTKLHSNVHITRITMLPSCHAIVLQGTSEQFALVERVINR